MKKMLFYLAVIIITAFFMLNIKEKDSIQETRGVFISYIEYTKYFQNKKSNEIEEEINKMINKVKNNNLNTIYLHVRPFSDSIYNSLIFPFSHTISGEQGKEIGLDVLEYFIEKAHQNSIKLHAWINPYRISSNTDSNFIKESNPAYKYLNTNHVKIIENKGIFYNPASDNVKELIVKGIEEIIRNYQVDGILLDDYFYPDDTIDLNDYEKVKENISLTEFRLANTNELINDIYTVVKKENPNIKFGVSPDGNISNNYDMHYADVKKWLSEADYIDYIMPQIYYGFTHESKPFIKTVNEWKDLISNDVKLIPVLASYKVGNIDEYTNTGKEEWIENDGIIEKQIKVLESTNNYNGFSLFRYDFL